MYVRKRRKLFQKEVSIAVLERNVQTCYLAQETTASRTVAGVPLNRLVCVARGWLVWHESAISELRLCVHKAETICTFHVL